MTRLYETVLSPAVMCLLIVTGAFFLGKLRLFWVLHPCRAAREMFGGRVGREVRRAVSMALAGTLGVGNIVGVSLAILVGGAGAVFWMLLTAFFAMAVKYAEVALAIRTRVSSPEGWVGGAPYYMGKRWLSVLFSLMCLACAVLEGCVIQANAIGEVALLAFDLPPLVTGVVLAVLALLLLPRGKAGIGGATATLIPIATAFYLILCLGVVGANLPEIPRAVGQILSGAFTREAGRGGILGYVFSRAAKQGCARGLLSNEAGCGTAPLAHVTADQTTPHRQGLWGVFEVFLDTVVVCTLTALAILTASPAGGDPAAPLAHLSRAFSGVWGRATPVLLAVCIFAFAFSTVLSWSFYGLSCLSALTKNRWARAGYLALLILSLPAGAHMAVGTAYAWTDLLLALMTLINLPVLLLRHKEITEGETPPKIQKEKPE